MKGGGGGGGGKRRWKVLVIGVMVLVILSMLVPLAFLLGLQNSFHSPGNLSLFFLSSISVFQIYSHLSTFIFLLQASSSLSNHLLL